MINATYKYWIWFSRIVGLSCAQKERLLKEFQSPEKIWGLDSKTLQQIEWLNYAEIKEIVSENYRKDLASYQQYIDTNKIKLITMFDDDYPETLKNIYDKPVILYAKGNVELLKKPGIAIVGSRSCSEYGKNVALKLAYDLAKHNITIISGLARGIDTYSHIGAVNAMGNTIAVIGNGLDRIYPYENRGLYERILQNNGLIITEYIMGTKPDRMNFPARNRIISALSDGVIVVEARKKSGALITADFALEQGKEIYAVPGNINSPNSQGTNELIKQGAYPITCMEDILMY